MRRFGSMGAGAIPIYAALIAASATVLGAFLNSAKDRRNQRAAILQDLEIIEKLPESWHSETGPFIVSTKRRMDIVAAEQQTARIRRWFLYTDSVCIALAFTTIWVQQRYHVQPLGLPDWAAIPAVIVVALILAWRLRQYEKVTEDAARWHRRDAGREWKFSELHWSEMALETSRSKEQNAYVELVEALSDLTSALVERSNVDRSLRDGEVALDVIADQTHRVIDSATVLPEHKSAYLSDTVDSLARISQQLVARADELS